MKKVILSLFLVLVTLGAFAQGGNGYKNAIGVRGGYNSGEFNFQRYLGISNRFEAGVGINMHGFETTAAYQWVFNIPSNTSGQFKWYIGPAISLGAWDNDNKHHDKSGFSFAAKGQVGFEYTFNFPLMLFVDYRPGLYFTPNTKFEWRGFGTGARFCF